MLNGTQRSPTVLVNYLPAFGQSCSFHLSDPFVCLNKVFFFIKNSISLNIYSQEVGLWHQGEMSLNPSSSTNQLYRHSQVI